MSPPPPDTRFQPYTAALTERAGGDAVDRGPVGINDRGQIVGAVRDPATDAVAA